MVVKGDVFDMTPLGMRFTVLETGADTDGKSLNLHWELYPGCNMKAPLVHTHPNAIETYEVLEGEMEFYVKDKWIPAKEGDKLSVPKNVAHSFRNPGNTVVKVYNTHQPALRMEEYFNDVCKVLDKVTDNRTREFKMNFNTMVYLSLLMNSYREEIIAKSPPDFIIRLIGMYAGLRRLQY